MEGTMTGRTKLPRGWLATLLGGILGTGIGGAVGAAGSAFYADRYTDGGLEDLVIFIIVVPIAAAIGAALGVAGMLKIFGHTRPVVSALLCVAIVIGVILTFLFIANNITPVAFNETIGVVLLVVVPPLAGAIGSRMLLSRSGALGADE
jgi:hypothetical protein